MRNLLFILTFLCTLTTLHAAENIFIGAADQNWKNPLNWSNGTLPNANEDVAIYISDVFIPKGFNAQARNINIFNEKSLLIKNQANLDAYDIGVFHGTLTNNGQIESRNLSVGSNPNNDPDHLGLFINNGALNFKDLPFSILKVRHGEVINHGTIFQPHDSGSYNFIHVSATSQFINFGSIEKYSMAKLFLFNEGLFVNEKTGEILFFKGAYPPPNVYNPIIDNKNTMINKGAIILDEDNANGFLTGLNMYSGAVFINEKEAFFSIKNARIFPIALQSNSIFHNYGMARFRPADDTNKMIKGGNPSNAEFINFSGSYFQGGGEIDNVEILFEETIIDPMEDNHLFGKIFFPEKVELNASIYKCQINGTAGGGEANGHDQIHTLKSVNIDGVLINVILSGGFVPNINDEFTILTTDDQIDGYLDDINLPNLPANRKWNVQITSNEIILRVISSGSNYTSQNPNQFSVIKNNVNTPQLESKIFPNPFSDLINIDVPSDKFEIYNSFGKVIYQSSIGSREVDFSTHAVGVYFIHYKENGELKVEKILKIE